MIFPRRYTQKGFTLVEVLVYLAVLIIASLIVVQTFFSLRTVFERNRIERQLADSATAVLDRVSREARQATAVDILNSTLNASSSVLTLTSAGTTTKFYLATSTVIVEQNGVTQGPLVPSDIRVTSLEFYRYTNSFSEAIRVGLTLSVSGAYASTTRTFYSTAVLRGSYE